MIISFSGLDGAGKSSCSDILSNELKRMNYKVKKLYLGNYFIIGLVPTIIRYLLNKKYKLNKNTSKKGFLLKLWMPLFFFDSFFYFFYIKILNLFYDYIITDRFFLDKIVSLNFLGYSNSFYNNLYINSFLKADIHFYLFNDIEILKNRETNDSHNIIFYKKMALNFSLFLNSLELIEVKTDDLNLTRRKIFKHLGFNIHN